MIPLTSTQKDNLAKAFRERPRREIIDLLLKEQRPLSQDYIRKSLNFSQRYTARHQEYLETRGVIVDHKVINECRLVVNEEYKPYVAHLMEVYSYENTTLAPEEKDNLAKGLSEPVRIDIIELLLSESKPVSQEYIMKVLRLKQACISRHQTYLEQTELVEVNKVLRIGRDSNVKRTHRDIKINEKYSLALLHILEVLGSPVTVKA